MAKRAKIKDGPTIAVRIEKGHLVPVSQYDAELLANWREGAILAVDPVLTVVRPMERRYFAMLSKLIRVAETPWSNTISAHEDIKLATGFVESYPKKDGEWKWEPRHISSFTDRELDEFFELFCGIVRERFKIDPETLRKEAADTGEESSGRVDTPHADDGPGADPIPASAGVPSTRWDTPDATYTAIATLTGDDLDWLRIAARMLVSASEPGGDVKVVDNQVKAIKQFLTPGLVSEQAKGIAQKIYRHCRISTHTNIPIDLKLVATLAGCAVDDLRAEAR